MPEDFTLNRVDKLRYRPSRDAEDFLTTLRTNLISGEKFLTARLAIARSVASDAPIEFLDDDCDRGSPIEGTHLFGEDTNVWSCIIAASYPHPIDNASIFRKLVEAHWHRGAMLLQDEYLDARRDATDFAITLTSLAGLGTTGEGGTVSPEPTVSKSILKLVYKVGEVSIDQRTNKTVQVELNAPGYSPHIALMGATRSGKTRTGIVIAQSIVKDSKIPVLFIDPKGEFVRDGKLLAKSEWRGCTLQDRFPNIQPIDVPNTPVPLDFLALPSNKIDATFPQMAIQFRDSFMKCIRVRGDVAMDDLRQAVEDLLHTQSGPVSLENIRDAISSQNQTNGKKKNAIESKLNELTSLRLFSPSLAPSDFFKRSWVIGLGGATDEAKRLVMTLLLDALSTYLLSIRDSDTDVLGYRDVRHLLMIDEAKEILALKHAALGNLVRKSAAKGGVVMLMSQSPEDFDQEEEDFLSQMGVIVVFKSKASSLKNLRAAFGKKVNPEEFGDKALPNGVALAKLPQADPTKIIAWA